MGISLKNGSTIHSLLTSISQGILWNSYLELVTPKTVFHPAACVCTRNRNKELMKADKTSIKLNTYSRIVMPFYREPSMELAQYQERTKVLDSKINSLLNAHMICLDWSPSSISLISLYIYITGIILGEKFATIGILPISVVNASPEPPYWSAYWADWTTLRNFHLLLYVSIRTRP